MTRPTGSTPRVRRVRAGLLAAALGLLAACGGGDDDGGDSAPETSSSPASTSASEPATGAPGGGDQQPAGTLEVTAVDFDFELPSTEMAAGDYTIGLTNEGGASHDLVVERDGEDVARIDPIRPGAEATLTVTLEPGEYVFYCSVGNHRSMGMEVTVTVT